MKLTREQRLTGRPVVTDLAPASAERVRLPRPVLLYSGRWLVAGTYPVAAGDVPEPYTVAVRATWPGAPEPSTVYLHPYEYQPLTDGVPT